MIVYREGKFILIKDGRVFGLYNHLPAVKGVRTVKGGTGSIYFIHSGNDDDVMPHLLLVDQKL